MQKTKFVIRAINKKTGAHSPRFYTKSSNVKLRIQRIKETLAQDTMPDYLLPFKGQQDELSFEVYKLAFVIDPDQKENLL